MSKARWILTIACCLVICALPVHADQWYTGEGVVSLTNLTPEQAKENALNKAREDALSKSQIEIVGVASQMMSESGNTGEIYDGFAQFTQRVTRGLILEERILENAMTTMQVGGETHYQWRVKLEARVESKLGKADPEFRIDVNLNATTFREGEELVMEFLATKDCYLTVLNLYSNDLLNVVVPNNMDPSFFLKAGERRTYPSKHDNFTLPLGLLPGKDLDQEAILVIATRENIPFSMQQTEEKAQLLSLDGAMMTINNWLAGIDANKRTQMLSSYQIGR